MEPSRPTLFARDIAAYSDTELDQYLEAYGRIVLVDDPENLDEDFIQRLRVRAGVNHKALSCPIDLNHVSARLGEVSADRENSPQPSSCASTEDLDDEECYRLNLEKDMEDYNKLINEGGRPSHPASLGRDVLENPGQYREILSYWQLVNNDAEWRVWKVFESQVRHWQRFREHQRRMRREGPIRYKGQKIEHGRFLVYCRIVTERLTRHGFERPFQLNEDLDQQDKLATWIEYLNYAYQRYDNHADTMEPLQQQHDEALKKLVDSNVLEPAETEESFDFLSFFFGLQLENEEREAKKAVESARLSVESAENALLKTQSSDLPRQSLSQQKLSTARSKLAMAKKSLERASKRCELIGDFIDQTSTYKHAKEDATEESILVRWILQQVPLIELELNPTKVSEMDSAGVNGGRKRGLKRDRIDDGNEEPASKRQRQHGENQTLLESKTRASPVRETSSTQQPRQTRSSRTNPSTVPSKFRSQRAPRTSKSSNTKSHTAIFSVVLDKNARVRKGRRRNTFSIGDTSDTQILRSSSRRRRPPERFQPSSNEPSPKKSHRRS